ncbi:hypothetical protein JW916_08995 [Candidatus Sumerlaeota bacterium]|nr:hypothetical protein [Candidatus Sumerlaeota bacterium]
MSVLESKKDLGQLLLEERFISAEQLNAAREVQAAQDKSIGRVLVDMGLMTEQAKMAFIHKKLGIEIVDIRNMQISHSILTRIPRSYAEKFRCVPILEERRGLVVAMEDPTNLMVLDQIKAETGLETVAVLSPLAEIEKAIEQYPALTPAQFDRLRERAQSAPWQILLHRLVFYLLMVAPLIAICVGPFIDDQFGNFLSHLGSKFDVTLYIVLTWCLWAIVVWEIDGLVFGGHEREA